VGKRSIFAGSPIELQIPDSIILALGGIFARISSILNKHSDNSKKDGFKKFFTLTPDTLAKTPLVPGGFGSLILISASGIFP
jgi:hypothetical protein